MASSPSVHAARLTADPLDVRPPTALQEFEAGHLVAAQHVPVVEVEGGGPALDAFLYDHALGASAIIVHCMFSAKRGPRGAKALQKKLRSLRAFRNQVYLLSGGIADFMAAHGDDASLVWLPDPAAGWKPVPH